MSDICFLIQVFVDAKQVKASNTSRGYQYILKNFENYIAGKELTPESINGFLAAAKKRGCTKSTVRTYYDILKNWVVWLHKRGYLNDFRIDMLEIPPHGKLVPRAPSKTTLKSIAKLLRDEINLAKDYKKFTLTRDLAIFSLLLECGLRVGEACALTINDVDMDMQKVIIADSKTSRARTVYFTEATAANLRQWLNYRSPDDPHFFQKKLNNGAKKISQGGTMLIFSRYQQRAGVPHFRVHDLRHACAVYRLANGQNLSDIQMILGHENIETTARYLMALDIDRAERDRKHSPLDMLL
jgi:integrase